MDNKYRPLHYPSNRKFIFHATLTRLAVLTCTLPFFGFIFCVIWSVVFNFTETTFTHCKVLNYLPSISAAIGNHMVQYIIWSLVITLHAPGRLLFLSIYNGYYKSVIKPQKHNLVKLASALNTLEILSLIGLTYIASATAYPIHEKLFITFISSSELYMLLACYMLKCHRCTPLDKNEKYSLKLKQRLIAVNMICFIIAGYFFVRHNRYCEPGIYTLFAFFEYIVVVSNMMFHMTAVLDFKGKSIIFHEAGYEVHN